MGRKITAHEATVHTATVEVRTLTISGRQVTLSVFRQLEKEDIIDLESMKLNGVPWGRVNYHPEKACDEPGHLHVVWQKGDELRRACVRERTGRRFADWEKASDAAQDENEGWWKEAFALAFLEKPESVEFTPHQPTEGVQEVGEPSSLFGRYTVPEVGWRTVADRFFSYRADEDMKALVSLARLAATVAGRRSDKTVWADGRYRLATREEAEAEARKAVQKAFAIDETATAKDAIAAWREARATAKRASDAYLLRCQQYDALYAGLLALPQLFIAT